MINTLTLRQHQTLVCQVFQLPGLFFKSIINVRSNLFQVRR